VKKSRYSEGQVLRILQEVDGGKPVVISARENGVSRATIHRWKAKYGGMTLSELKRLRVLEEENGRLKRIVAQQAMDIELLREVNAKNW
jgi:putative transposase